MFSRVSSFMVALALVAFVAACSKAPEGELKASEDAIQEAYLADAADYAPALYQLALDTLNAAKVEMQKQDARFSAFRTYGSSRQLLTIAQQLADSAVTETNLARERVRLQDSALIVEIDSLLISADQSLATAPTGKGSRADVELLKSRLATLRGSFASAKQTVADGDYMVAKAELETVTTQVANLIATVEAVKSRASSRPKT